MTHFNVLRWQDGGGISAFSLLVQICSITIIYVIKIEGRKESIQVLDSAQWAKLAFRGEGSFPGGKAPLPQQVFTSPRRALGLDARPAVIQGNRGSQGAVLSSARTRAKVVPSKASAANGQGRGSFTGQVGVCKVRKKKMAPSPLPPSPDPKRERGTMCPDPCYHLPPHPPRLRQGKSPTALLGRCDSKFKAKVTDLHPKAFKGERDASVPDSLILV